jgi:hypothetical protein
MLRQWHQIAEDTARPPDPRTTIMTPSVLPIRGLSEADMIEASGTSAIERLSRLGYEEFRSSIRDSREKEMAAYHPEAKLEPYPLGPSWDGLAEADRIAWRRAAVTILVAFDEG